MSDRSIESNGFPKFLLMKPAPLVKILTITSKCQQNGVFKTCSSIKMQFLKQYSFEGVTSLFGLAPFPYVHFAIFLFKPPPPLGE